MWGFKKPEDYKNFVSMPTVLKPSILSFSISWALLEKQPVA